MSNERSARTTHDTLKLGLREKVQIGFIAVGGFFGIVQGGAERVGAAVGEPIDHGAHDALTTTTAVLKGAAEGVAGTVADNQPPHNRAEDTFNKAVEKRYHLPGGH